jgi:hypothetical protein
MLRRIFNRNDLDIVAAMPGDEHNEYPDSIFSELEDDDNSEDNEDLDDLLSDIGVDYDDDDYEDDYENDDEDFDTEDEVPLYSFAVGLADNEWEDTDESDSDDDDVSGEVGVGTDTTDAPWGDVWGNMASASQLPLWGSPQLSDAPSVSGEHTAASSVWDEPQPSDEHAAALAWDEPQPSDAPSDLGEHTAAPQEEEETMYYDYNCTVESEYDEEDDYDDDGFY